jgi:hypothetical protein
MKAIIKTENEEGFIEENGWIEVDESLNIEWQMDIDHPRKHDLRKEICAIEGDHKPIILKDHRAAIMDNGVVGDGLEGEPKPVDVLYTIKKRIDENLGQPGETLVVDYKQLDVDTIL